MYQALYRKYRSQTFGQLVGQQVVATTLRQAVEQGKISHAYLFSGPRGTGKTSVAKIFAKAMNCPNQKDGEPCNDCYICKAITEGSLEDVIEIDAASNNGVDEIRDIRDKSTYAPSMAKHKVYIIDEVHMLSTGAFNALLKTLEEPTENVVFILATTELHKIPATILSRVQRFEFKSIKTQDIIGHIEWILEQEGIDFEQEGVQIIARRAEGGMRDALSILDQALSLTQENRLTTDIAEEITGSISLGALDAYVAALIAHDAVTALDNLNLIFDSGKNMARFVTDLLQYLRDLIIVKTGGENTHASELFLENLKTPQETLFAMIKTATKSLADIKNSLQPKIYTEMMTIRLAEEKASSDQIPDNLVEELSNLKQEIQELKQQLANVGSQPAPAAKKSEARSQKAKTYRVDRNKVNAILEEAVENPELARSNLTKLQNAWGEIIESLAGADKALLIGSQPVAANENHAILAFESHFNAEQTMKRENLNTMFGNLLSNVAGFSPDILAISLEDWTQIRAEFSARSRGNKAEAAEKQEESLIPEGFDFLAEKITVQDD
ncbi:DNA polymerase III, subunit gamma and tau [Streptococcus cristatus ATCC 51100]|uniref:DNA-directed DNA polymerase n=2 Tax=Streptococcus cristatus TaxID=45634 RepID=A0AAV3EF86_STRCR|nr:DNA polymerase III subunit gamma/tau [Streptococcus cristatus]EFX53471.1 DNA polymerase III, subunit gamma and tau [Streptococcus cristatus ATCC 51100]EGU67952.1 DNA polymerase III, subunit gamma and tau [Streptococcus cristatus ATCC 51100]KJQ56850.1 DNA polymerase III subunits gamma and tau [Streptococcus cristatus]RSJ77796.1 DNA polymerase III subunit tau [Streptococcus cristatus]SQG32479.1 DNA polymerase III subunits gamma and tau [Streptococcus cristatus ATCC 51100]